MTSAFTVEYKGGRAQIMQWCDEDFQNYKYGDPMSISDVEVKMRELQQLEMIAARERFSK